MNKIITLVLAIGLIAVSCSDPNTIGLEIQPTSDNIIISSADFESLTSATESEDSLRTDEAESLVLGKIYDPNNFVYNSSSFLTQVLLTENNTDLGSNPIADSVVLSYTYSGYYGDLRDFDNLIITKLNQSIDKDSDYHSNFSYSYNGEENLAQSWVLNKEILTPILKVNLGGAFAQELLDLTNTAFVDNVTFLKYLRGFFVSVVAENTMVYLNPNGSNSYFKIYYHNDESDSLSLDFELGGEAARFSLFNEKHEESIIADDSRIYIQSMAGYKAKITIGDLTALKDTLKGKAINKVTISFDIEEGSQSEYAAHDRLLLGRVNQDGNNVTVLDYNNGLTHFGGKLTDDECYEFNITRYFYQLLNNEDYTNYLYLTPYRIDGRVNANRTILDKDIKLTIDYSEL